MRLTVYWRKDRIEFYDIWKFRVGNCSFSCSRLSSHKKKRPKRIFIREAVYRGRSEFTFNKDGEFEVEDDKEVWKKLRK